ncbi:MAG TPA: polysaccharide deacetylase family protein [Myxococcales bacterium]|nr:polysaccharide deacetylase family protein [Myxococcales bacterium]
MFSLTFDDGPGPDTEALLDVLRAHAARATFFLIGRNLEQAPWCGDPARAAQTAARAFAEGHVLGNHTYSHLRPDRWRELAADIRRGEAAVRSIAGPQTRVPFRLPYGVRSFPGGFPLGNIGEDLDPRLAVVASLGLSHQHWTSDFDDWTLPPEAAPALAQAMIAHVARCEAAGLDAVLDLHDSGTGSSSGYSRKATVAGVRQFLQEADRRGWRSFTV